MRLYYASKYKSLAKPENWIIQQRTHFTDVVNEYTIIDTVFYEFVAAGTYEEVREYMHEAQKMSKVCKKFDISEETYYTVKAVCALHGMDVEEYLEIAKQCRKDIESEQLEKLFGKQE
jgi:phosphoribulokinase